MTRSLVGLTGRRQEQLPEQDSGVLLSSTLMAYTQYPGYGLRIYFIVLAVHQIKVFYGSSVANVCSCSVFIWFYFTGLQTWLRLRWWGVSSVSTVTLLQKVMRRQQGRFPYANKASFFFLGLWRNRTQRLPSRRDPEPSPPNLLGGHSKVIGENEFSRHKTFVTQTELGHLDGIPPQARLHWWWHKSRCYRAIKKCQLSDWGRSGCELFFSLSCYTKTTFEKNTALKAKAAIILETHPAIP